ncbi:MAG TPA: hypothetical protein VI731_12220 [Bacteroidia bacterium]|nr:hypothetical protein [Bacteroidia bacterium]
MKKTLIILAAILLSLVGIPRELHAACSTPVTGTITHSVGAAVSVSPPEEVNAVTPDPVNTKEPKKKSKKSNASGSYGGVYISVGALLIIIIILILLF